MQNKKAELIKVSPGKRLDDFIRREIQRLGYNFPDSRWYNPIISYIPTETIDKVLEKGTDRDPSSPMDLEEHYRAINREGLNPGQVIYTIDIAFLESRLPNGKSVAVYNPEELLPVQNVGGLYRARNTFLDALIGVFY